MALSKVQGAQIESPVDISAVNLTGVTTAARLVGTAVSVTAGGLVVGIATVNNINTTQLNVTGVTTAAQLNVGTGGTVITTTNSGDVGIGTVLPVSGKLHVLDGNIRISGTSENVLKIRHDTAGSDSNISQTDDGSLRYRYGEDERLRITSDGDLVIKTSGTMPIGKFVFQEGSDDAFSFRTTGANGAFEIYDEWDNETRFHINTSGNIGIGTDNPQAKLHVSGGNIKVDSGYGIDFSATANSSGTMTSELLDDYEEGTWTPTTNSSGYTISSSSGFYTKIGRQVTCYFRVAFSAINSSSNSTVTIQGYPFTNNSPNHIAGVCRESTNVGAVYAVQINNGNTAGGLNSYSGVANGSARTLAINETYECNITYFTNA